MLIWWCSALCFDKVLVWGDLIALLQTYAAHFMAIAVRDVVVVIWYPLCLYTGQQAFT